MTNKKIKVMTLALVLLMGFSSIFAGEVTFFGPKQYTRGKGKPVTIEDNFTVPLNYAGPNFKITVINGSPQGENRVSSAEIKLNGEVIFAPKDFNQQVGLIERTVELKASNLLSIKLNSKPDSYLIINIHKFIYPPEVTFTANPETIDYLQSSTLSWNVVYADSISIDNGIGNVGNTGLLQVSPEVPTTTYTLTAVNLGGETEKQASVTVIFPVPTVTFQASPLYVKPGASSILTWSSFAAHTVSIEPGIGSVQLNGSQSVSPTETTIYTITAVGYGGTQTAAATVNVDGIPAQINVTDPVDNSYLSSSNVVVKGQVIDSSPVILKVNGSDVPLQPENYFEVPLQLNEGTETINLYAEDAAGNLSTRQVNVIVDTTAPQVQITTPQNNAVIREIPITVTGTFAEINPLKILLNNTIEGTISGDGFTFANVNLVEGENQLLVKLEDKAGNSGSANITVNYIPDSEPPVLTITSPENGEYLGKVNVTVNGTVTDKSNILYVRVNGINAVIDADNNTYTADLTLAEGANTITVESEDEHQNKDSISIAVTVDFTAPQITVSSPRSGSVTNKDKITITGGITDAYPHQVTLTGGSAGSVQGELIGGNFYFKDIVLSEGENAFTLVCQDRAGNSGQSEITVVRDSQPPQLNVLQPVPGTLLPVQSVLVKGTASDSGLKEVRVNNIICPLTNNEFSLLLNLVEGSNMIDVRALDLAGNLKSESLQVTVDSIAPNLNITAPTANAILNTPTVTVSGRVDEMNLPGVTVKVNGQNVPLSNNEFSVDSVSLQEGKNEIVVEVSDAVGNQTTKVIPVTLDTVSPSIVKVVPGDQLTAVPLSYHVSVEFSEEIDENTLTSQGFYLRCNSENIDGTISLEGSSCIFKPLALLPSDAEITVHITDLLKDLAGNVLSNPQVVTFFTRDKTAPSAPQLQPLPEKTALTKVMVEGSAENLAQIFITGGASSVVQGACDDTGNFSLEVPLKENQLNQLCVVAKDSSNNESLASCISIYQEGVEFIVTDAQLETTVNQITANFSRPIDASTLTSANFTVSSGTGILSGTLSVASGSTTGIFTPESGVDLSSQVVILEIKTGIKDQEGIGLSYPFTRVFNQQGTGNVILQGEVYDDGTGLPLSGAVVKLIRVNGSEPPPPVPTTMSTSEGKYLLLVPEGECLIRISKENYTSSDRKIISVSGFSSAVFDSRLMPITCEKTPMSPSGDIIKSFCGGSRGAVFTKSAPLAAGGIKGIVIYPEGAIDTERPGRMTAVGVQALQGRLPAGWSPLGVFDIRVNGMDAFLQPCLLRLVNQWPEVEVSSMTLGYWDEDTSQWVCASAVSISPEEMTGTIEKLGQYAFLIKDSTPVAPPNPVVDQPLPAVTTGSIPTDIATKLDFNPTEIYPGDIARALLTINSKTSPGTAAVVSSGVPVQAKISEKYEMLSGGIASYVPYTADLTAYNFGSNTTEVGFYLSANTRVALSWLKEGRIKSDLVRYSAGALGMVVGVDGGTVSGDGGAEIIIEPNSLDSPAAVTIQKADLAEISSKVPMPSGFEMIGAIDLSLGGVNLLKPAAISLPLTQEQINTIPQDAQLFVVKLEKIDVELSWLLQGQGIVESGRIRSFIDAAKGLSFPGIKQGGTYLFLQALSPMGFISGTVTKDTNPITGAIVSVITQDIKAISSGSYVQIGFIGDLELTAKDLAARDEGSGSAVIDNRGDIVALNLIILKTGPQVLSITPENNADNVPLNSKITFIFSEPVNAGTFNDQAVFINKGAEKVVGQFKLSSDGKQGEFIPHEDFPSDSLINITVTTNLKDLQSNPMAAVFSSAFTTIDVIPPTFDPSGITVYMPEDGTVRIKVEENILAVGDKITVFNPRTGKSVTYTVNSTDPFEREFAVDALVSDQLKISVFDKANNETVLPPKPFVSADGKRVILGSRAAEFVSSEGLGIKIQEGTFSEPTTIGLYEITDPSILAPEPPDFQRLKALTLDFSGKIARKPVDISIPVPSGITEADVGKIFFAREVEVHGQKRVMIIDSAVITNGRIYTACEPFEDYCKQFDGSISVLKANFDTSIAFVNGTVASPTTVVLAGEICYIPDNYYYVFPVPVNTQVNIVVKDLHTAATIYEKTTPGPSLAGQVYNFEKVTDQSDKEPPMIVKSTGLLTIGFDVTGQTNENQGIKIIPNKDTQEQVTSIKIEGAAGTAATKTIGDGTPFAAIRVYKLKKQENSDKYIYEEIQEIEALANGSFSQDNIDAKHGDQVIITVEKGGIALNQEFVLSFSEPLDINYENNGVPISIYDKSGNEIDTNAELLEVNGHVTGTDVIVKLENQLDENQVYVLKTEDNLGNGLSDRSGNQLKISCNFRAKKSYRLFEETGTHDVLDTVLLGSTLFVASGFEGIRIFDVSNPSNINLITTYTNFAGKVQGLAKYKKDESSPYQLIAVGGGSSCLGFIKVLDISNLSNIVQIKSQIISDNLTDSVKLPQGHPRYVRVLGQYAFVTIRGAGLAVVDIEGMTAQSNRYNLNAVIRYHHEGFISDAAAYQRLIKDPNNPEDPGKQQVLAVVLVNNYGIRILDMNRQDNEDPIDPYSKYNMKEVGSYQLPSTMQNLLAGLELAQDYWVDVDQDGLRGEDEDNDEDGVSAEDEKRDVVFFAIPSTKQIIVLDITKIESGIFAYGVMQIRNEEGDYAVNMRDLEISEEDQVLYATDMQMGLVILDMSISGKTLDSKTVAERFLGSIHTSGHSQFGLTIDPDLHLAIVGQADKGVDVIKLENPEIKFVYKTPGGIYREVTKICPSGIKPADNPGNYPDEIYVMALLPGGIARALSVDDKTAYCELWALNSAQAPIIPWDNSKIKSYIKKLELYRQSDNPVDDMYKVFLSKPIRVTIAPEEQMMAETSEGQILSGDIMWVHLPIAFINQYNQGKYINPLEAMQIADKKPSIRADLIDREENFDFAGVPAGAVEKPNSPANNPSIYSNVLLHSGELARDEIDLHIPGRGFDFIFARTYRSQSIYSGPLGWGWDHNYNKRIQELYSGDIIYYDGSGRRERYKKDQKTRKYQAPKGWFTQLQKMVDGTFRLIYPDLTVEFFDSVGRLIKVQDINTNKMEFFYDISGQLSTIMDTMGRLINLEYYPVTMNSAGDEVLPISGRLWKIIDFSDPVRTVEYEYYDNGDLKSVDFEGRVKQYGYRQAADIQLAHNLETFIDPRGTALQNNTPVLKVIYNTSDQVGQLDFIELTQNIIFNIGSTSTTVTDARGSDKEFINPAGNHREVKNGNHTTTYDLNNDDLITLITLPEGNMIRYTYDTANAYRRSQGNLLSVSSEGPDGIIKTDYVYNNHYNQVVEITDPMTKKTTIKRDGRGNPDIVTLPQTTQNPQPISYDYDFNTYGQLEKVTNPLGSVTRYKYYPEASPSGTGIPTITGRIPDPNTGGYLQQVIIDQGNDNISQTFTYDEVGNITTVKDGENVTTTYGYTDSNGIKNPFGEVLTLTQGATGSNDGQPAVNLVTTFSYDENSNVIGSQSRGVTTTNTYDRLNRLRYVLNQGGAAETPISQQCEYIYDNNSNLRFIIYPRGNKDEFTYNNRDLLESKILGNGLTTESYIYWPNGNILKYTDGESKDYQYIHDSHGRLKDIIDPFGNKLSYGYDNNSNVTSVNGIGIDGKTFNQDFVYDTLNRMTHHNIQKDAGSITTQYGYNAASHLTSVLTPNQHTWGITPTGSGLPHLITDPLNNTDDHRYDKRGWVKHIYENESGGRSLTRNFTNTVLGTPNLRGDSMSRDYQHTYHSNNHLLDTIQDPEKGEVSYKYDGLNRLKTETRKIKYQEIEKPAGTTFEYDENGNPWKVTDAKGNTTRYEYDNKDRLIDIFYPGTTNEHITYNGRDQVLTYTDLNGTLVVNTYDDTGRLTDRTITPAAGIEGPTSEHFEYDGLNRLTLASNSDSEVTFIYNKAGRLEREIQKIKESEAGVENIVATYEVVYQYDNNGNKTQVTYPSGKVITITPDALDRIDHIKENDKLLVDYTYEGKGKIVGKNLQDVIFMESIFDDGRRPESLSYKSKINNEYIPFLSRGMNWSLTDLKKHDIDNGKKEAFTYDSAYRLRKVENVQDNTTYEYEIDGVEDVKQFTVTQNGIPEIKGTDCNERHQLVKYNGMDLNYDNNGNLTHFTHDYVYNWKNQLVKVITGTGVNVEYKYDALGRRIVKKVKDPNSETVTRYVHDGYQVIEERDINDQVQYRYTYGNGIDERIEIEKREKNQDGNYEWKSYLPLHDSIGNVTALTNDKGHLIERYNYSPYGEVTYFNTESAPGIDYVRIKDGVIRIKFDRPVEPGKIYIHLYIKSTQEVITGDKEYIDIEEIGYRTSTLPTDETLTLNLKTQSGPDEPIEIFSQDFTYQGEADVIVHDGGKPYVKKEVQIENNIVIIFNEEIDPDTTTYEVELEKNNIKIDGTLVRTGANEYKFIPSGGLVKDAAYKLRMSGFKDLLGNAMDDLEHSFVSTYNNTLIFEASILTANNHSVVGNTSLMHGRTYEPEVGLYYFRNRYYHPQLGRFLQQDPNGYEDSLNMYQAFNQNPFNFVDPFGNVIKAEIGKHDMFKTKEVKTGKWYLDYTVVGAFNELRNLSALGINLVSNLFGTTEDIVFDVGDYGLSKVGMIERGELRDDPHMRNLFNAIMLTNPEAMASGTRTIMNKLDDLTLSLYNLVKSKGGKVLEIRGNTIISTGTELSGDDLARVFGRGDDIYYTIDDLPIMSTDDVKAALQSGNYTKSQKWAYSIHEHHWYPQWLGGKSSGVTSSVRGFEHITGLETSLFEHIKKSIPIIKQKSWQHVRRLLSQKKVAQQQITDALIDFYKMKYPNLDEGVIKKAVIEGLK